MTSRNMRLLIRLGGFCGGVLAMLVMYPPWQERTVPHLVSDIVLAFAGGFIGVAIAEIGRRRIPEQRQIEIEEEHSLTEAEVAALVAVRRRVRLAAVLLGLVLPFLVYPWREFKAHLAVGVGLCIYAAFFVLLVAEILLSLSRKQQIATRVLRHRKS